MVYLEPHINIVRKLQDKNMKSKHDSKDNYHY